MQVIYGIVTSIIFCVGAVAVVSLPHVRRDVDGLEIQNFWS